MDNNIVLIIGLIIHTCIATVFGLVIFDMSRNNSISKLTKYVLITILVSGLLFIVYPIIWIGFAVVMLGIVYRDKII